MNAPENEPGDLAARTDYRKPVCVIGPNPAIDYTLEVPNFVPGGVNRTGTVMRVAGGKPVNVARTLVRLGVVPRLVSPLGGSAGHLIAEAASELGIQLWSTPIHEPTRTAVVIADTANRRYTVINERGPELDAHEAHAYAGLTAAAIPDSSLLLASGSLPPGLDDDFYAALAREARIAAVPLILDTSGEALRRALEARPWAVKINGDELDAATGTADRAAAAGRLRDRGIDHVVVTLGREGALYAGPEGTFSIDTLPIEPVNATAAGDAFLAGLAASLSRGRSWLVSLKCASAAAGVVASQLGPDIGPGRDIDLLAGQIAVRPV